MKPLKLVATTALAFASAVAFSSSAQAAVPVVVDGSCISVTDVSGCLFTNNIAPNTVAATQSAYNLYNDTHVSAAPDIALTYLFKSDDGAGFLGSITGGGTASGTWSTPGYLISFLAVKAADYFVLYELTVPASSGLWNTFNIPFKNNPHDLSHLAFFGAADDGGGGIGSTVPEPATWALLFAGFGMVGIAARRRNRAISA